MIKLILVLQKCSLLLPVKLSLLISFLLLFTMFTIAGRVITLNRATQKKKPRTYVQKMKEQQFCWYCKVEVAIAISIEQEKKKAQYCYRNIEKVNNLLEQFFHKCLYLYSFSCNITYSGKVSLLINFLFCGLFYTNTLLTALIRIS